MGACGSVKAPSDGASVGTFTYFAGIHARGEPIRILLAYKGVKYTADDISMQEFGERKMGGKLPSGQVPIWTENGLQMNQTGSVLRFLARRHGLHPKDENKAWEVDSFYDYHADVIGKISGVVMKGADPATYEEAVTSYVAEVDKRLAKHGKQFLTGSEFTSADCTAAVMFLCWVYNDSFAKGSGLNKKGIAIVEKNARVCAYANTLKTVLAGYLANRTPGPM